MLSTRGAISTSVAMVECASGQNMANRDVFLLSELEKVWVTHAVLARRLLLDTQPSSSSSSTASTAAATAAAKAVTAVQIPHFGSFWTEPQLLHVDVHRRRYTTRRLCFGLCRHFATRYGVDTSKVPLEPQYCHHAHGSAAAAATTCRAIHTAEVVELCGVPAHTAQAALREFVLYVGEGLYRGRVFALALPGIATLVMKREKVMLTPDAELLRDMYALDARRWPVAVREACDGAHAEQMMLWQQQQQQPTSLSASSRPVSSSSSSRPVSSRVSWRSNGRTASTTTATATADVTPRPTFVTACPAGRLFSDIAKEQQQRRYAAAVAQAQGVEQTTNATQWQQEQPLQRWHAMEQRVQQQQQQQQQHACDDDHQSDKGSEGDDDDAAPYSGESVYKLVADASVGDDDDADDNGHTHSIARAQAAAAAVSLSSAQHIGEPEVESCEVVADGGVTRTHAQAQSQPHTLPRPMGGKDAQLEAVLRREERFSRPISRQTFHEQCSAQQLIYGEHNTTTAATLPATTRAGQGHRDAAAGVRLRHAL